MTGHKVQKTGRFPFSQPAPVDCSGVKLDRLALDRPVELGDLVELDLSMYGFRAR